MHKIDNQKYSKRRKINCTLIRQLCPIEIPLVLTLIRIDALRKSLTFPKHRTKTKHDSRHSFTHNKRVSFSSQAIGSYLVTQNLLLCSRQFGSYPKNLDTYDDDECARDPKRKRALNQGRISHTTTASLSSIHK